MSLSVQRVDKRTGRVARSVQRTGSVSSMASRAYTHSIPPWVKIKESPATRDDLAQYHEYITDRMRQLYGLIQAGGNELTQDTVKAIKWFDEKLQEEHRKMLETISGLKEGIDGETTITGERLRHADQVFEQFRAHVVEGINNQAVAFQEALDKHDLDTQDVNSKLDHMMKEIILLRTRDMEKGVQLMAASRRYEELENRLGERLASYLSDQVEKKREKASERRRKPAGNDGNEEMRDVGGAPPGGGPAETLQGDGVVGGNC